jgi:DNA-directed RNA polymerase beta subunit
MGFPLLTYQNRSDNKLYRLQTPQSPLVRPCMYDFYDMDNYPIGTNAIVAVISYTGYDMEDAMVSILVVTLQSFSIAVCELSYCEITEGMFVCPHGRNTFVL